LAVFKHLLHATSNFFHARGFSWGFGDVQLEGVKLATRKRMEFFLSLESCLEDGVSHPLVGIDPPIPLKPLIGTPLLKGLI